MNSRATRAVVGASQQGLVRPDNDFFVTHPDSIRALIEVEHLGGTIWEPAAGDGMMSSILRCAPGVTEVYQSDIFPRAPGIIEADFLGVRSLATDRPYPTHIVTNPPFDLAEEFVYKALALDPPGKVAMFLRLAFLEGKKRGQELYASRPPARVWVFSSRQPLRRNGGPWQSGLIAFAWFVWQRDPVPVGGTKLGWLP